MSKLYSHRVMIIGEFHLTDKIIKNKQMKSLIQKSLVFGSLLLIVFFQNVQAQNSKTMDTTISHNSIFPKGQLGSADYFTGTVWVTPLLADDGINHFSIGNVVFEVGARANWHTHPRGQVLIVTDGQGFYQEKGKPAQPIKKGDVINIPPHVEHWHGASANSAMTHIAITNFEKEEFVTWLNPVTDEEFTTANQEK